MEPYDKIQHRFVPLSEEGRVLSGVAITYGDVADLPFGREKVLPKAFSPLGDVILNKQHQRSMPLARTGGGGLVLTDTDEELRIEATLDDITDCNDVLKLVRQKVLRGFSIEFKPKVITQDGDIFVIREAELSGIAVVDRPAYTDTEVNVRHYTTKKPILFI